MNFLLENWFLILLVVAALVVAAKFVMGFLQSNREEQLKSIREWLLYATTMAEKELGGGTGKLKLRYVYDLFVSKFPWLAKVVSFDKFSGLVESVLSDMNRLLNSNQAVRQYVDTKIEN